MYQVIFLINHRRDFWEIWNCLRFTRAISKFSKMHLGQWSICGETKYLIYTCRNWKLSQRQSKDTDTFLKICSFFRCYFHFFAIATQLPGFSISRLANAEDFFNVNVFFKFKLNINVSINNHSLYLCSVLLKTLFILPHLFCNVDFELNRLIEFQNKMDIEIVGS